MPSPQLLTCVQAVPMHSAHFALHSSGAQPLHHHCACHAQRAPEKRPPAKVSLVFTGAAMAPLLVVMLAALTLVKVNFNVGGSLGVLRHRSGKNRPRGAGRVGGQQWDNRGVGAEVSPSGGHA